MNKDGKNLIFNRILYGLFAGLILAGTFILGYYSRGWTAPDGLQDVEYVLKMIEENYVGEFDRDEFISAAVRGSLDRYSAYYSPSEYNDVNLSKEGITQGKLGVMFYDKSNVIAAVSGNSPAERAGIAEGGKIVGIKLHGGSDFVSVTSYDDFNAEYEKAEKNVPLKLRVEYNGEVAEYELAREDFIESYVWYQDGTSAYNVVQNGNDWLLEKREKPLKSQINDGFAYIKLSSFNGKAAMQMRTALNKMKESGIKKLVLDLRSNGGGYMDILTDIAAHLIPGGKKQVISVAKYKSGKSYGFYTENNFYDNYGYEKIAVLGNSGTASASEALIGAMLDYDQSHGKNIVNVIVSQSSEGEYRTYGKGIMQTTFENLSTGSAIKLTTANIYWPVSGKCIHGNGVTPDTDARVTGVAPVQGEDAELNAAMA